MSCSQVYIFFYIKAQEEPGYNVCGFKQSAAGTSCMSLYIHEIGFLQAENMIMYTNQNVPNTIMLHHAILPCLCHLKLFELKNGMTVV